MPNQLEAYLGLHGKEREILKDKHLLFDTSSVVQILKYDALRLLEDLGKLDVIPCIIDPMITELLRVDRVGTREERFRILTE